MIETNYQIAPSAGQLAKQNGAGSSGSNGLASDFDVFLKMLTTQAQNQDPLNPVDATDYASQLASFSAVEQQVLTNERLSILTEKIDGQSLDGLSSWLGSDVAVGGSGYFTDEPLEILVGSASPVDTADRAILVARDQAGAEVSRQLIPAGAQNVFWSGDNRMNLAPLAGSYSFSVEHYSGETLASTTVPLVYNRVVESMLSSEGGVSLALEGGATINADAVTFVRKK